MSVYQSEKGQQEWAERDLKQYLDAAEYPLLFAALRAPKRSARLSRVDLGVLRVLLTGQRAGDDEVDRALLSSMTREQIAEIVCCHPSSVNRSVRRLNRLVRQGARLGTDARKNGLILFHDKGYPQIKQPKLGDVKRSRGYSERALVPQVEAHQGNIALADEIMPSAIEREQFMRFRQLSPVQRAALLAHAG